MAKAITYTRIPSQNDWRIAFNNTADDWLMDQNEPIDALEKRVRWSIPVNAMVRIGYPEKVPGVGPAFTEPFRAGDVWPPAAGGENSEPVFKFPIAQRNLEYWLFSD